MNKNKLVYALPLLMLVSVSTAFSANTITSNHNQASFTQGGVVINPNHPGSNNPNSEFASSSFVPSEDLSGSLFSLPKKDKFSKQASSFRKDAEFSGRSTFAPHSENGEFSSASFSIHDSGEFSNSPSSTPQYNNSEFSNQPVTPSSGSLSRP